MPKRHCLKPLLLGQLLGTYIFFNNRRGEKIQQSFSTEDFFEKNRSGKSSLKAAIISLNIRTLEYSVMLFAGKHHQLE